MAVSGHSLGRMTSISVPAAGGAFGAVVNSQKSAERLIDILESALQILSTKGEVGLTMRELARVSGISLGNLQYYYVSSDDMISGVADYLCAKYVAWMEPIKADMSVDGDTAFCSMIDAVLNDIKDSGTQNIFFSLWSMAKRNASTALSVDRLYTAGRRMVEGFLQRCSTPLSERQRCLRAALILMQVEGLMVLAAHGMRGHPELDGLFDEARSQILRLARAP